MQAREHALRRHFAQRPCKTCHQLAAPETLLVLVRRHSVWMVLVGCAICHQRSLYTISFAKTSRQAHATAAAHLPISSRDVVAMHSFLDGFNGDFLGLFGAGPQGGFAVD